MAQSTSTDEVASESVAKTAESSKARCSTALEAPKASAACASQSCSTVSVFPSQSSSGQTISNSVDVSKMSLQPQALDVSASSSLSIEHPSSSPPSQFSGISKLYWSLVRDGALPSGFIREFESLAPVLVESADRIQRKVLSVDDVQHAVLIHEMKVNIQRGQFLEKLTWTNSSLLRQSNLAGFMQDSSLLDLKVQVLATMQKAPNAPGGSWSSQTPCEARRPPWASFWERNLEVFRCWEAD